MATLVLQVPDESLVSKVKQACKMLMGVASVKVQKDAKPKKFDITKTAGFQEALDDVKHGRVTHYDSVDDMFRSVLGEEAFSKLRSSNVQNQRVVTWECHIQPDWLMTWEQNDTQLTLLFLRTGTHSDLF